MKETITWKGDVSRLHLEPGDVVVVEGCTPEMFRESEAIRSLFPGHTVFLLAPTQSLQSLDERLMARHGWTRIPPEQDRTVPCNDAGCTDKFPSERAMKAHYRIVHTEAGRQQVAKMHAARGKK